MAEYSADAPLSASANDQFQRWPFARRVARVIASRSDPESIVIGINGAWGEGKTTVFNFIEEELKQHPQVISFRFNPWRFPDETKLIEDFFRSLAGAVDKKIDTSREKLGSFIGKYIAIPASLAGGGEAARAVSEILSSVELKELKRRVEAILKEADKRVVVLMDDIDRLDKNEIQSVFRLVKLVADFQNTAYVLAFDAEVVASALQERYSGRDVQAGQNFLEKIIQVPLDLPQIATSSLRAFCFRILETVLRDAGIALGDDEVRQLVMAFDAGLLPRLKTPRMARRFGNILSFALPILKDEVNTVDLILIEGIRIFYPRLYDCIRDNPGVFLGSGSEWRGNDDRDRKTQAVVAEALSGLSPEEAKASAELLGQLFPMVQGAFGGVRYVQSSAEQWAAERRVASADYFQRFFSYAIPEGQISDAELAEFFRSLTTGSVEANAAELKRLCGSQNAEYVISKCRAMIDELPAEAASKLAGAVVADAGIYPNPEQAWKFTTPFYQAAMLVSGLISRVTLLQGKEEGVRFAQSLIRRAEPLRFAFEAMNWIRFADDAGESAIDHRTRGPAFSPDDRRVIGRVFVERLQAALADPAVAAGSIPLADLIQYLAAWKRFDPMAATSEYVSRLLPLHEAMPVALLNAIRPTAWNTMTGQPRKHEFGRQEYDFLASFADPELFRQVLEEQIGAYTPTAAFPKDYEDTEPLRSLVEQFCWVHAFVQKEKAANVASDNEHGIDPITNDDPPKPTLPEVAEK
jgi:KAP family P-loop domain